MANKRITDHPVEGQGPSKTYSWQTSSDHMDKVSKNKNDEDFNEQDEEQETSAPFEICSETSENQLLFITKLCSEQPTINYKKCPLVNHRYKIVSFLDGGGDGNVFEAYDLCRFRLKVALKIWGNECNESKFPTSELKVFKRLQGLAEFSESCIVKMLDSFLFLDHVFISFELLGPSVKDILNLNQTGFPQRFVREMMFQLLTAVSFLHKNGVIHTDIKPANLVFVNSNFKDMKSSSGKTYRSMDTFNIKLIDLDQLVSTSWGRTSFKHIVTTTPYRAPEVVLGLEWDYKCDSWSIGCTLYELYFYQYLFKMEKFEECEDEELLFLLCQIEAFADKEIPLEMARNSKNNDWFDESGTLMYNLKYSFSQYYEVNHKKYQALRVQLYAGEPSCLSTNPYYKLLMDLLQIDPVQRLSAIDAFKNNWFDSLR